MSTEDLKKQIKQQKSIYNTLFQTAKRQIEITQKNNDFYLKCIEELKTQEYILNNLQKQTASKLI